MAYREAAVVDGERLSEEDPDEPWSVFDEDWPDRARSASPPVLARMCPKIPALVQTRKRCGKPTCRCARGELHGPYWTLRWRDGTAHRRKHVGSEEILGVRAILEGRRRDRAELRGDLAEADRLGAALWGLMPDGTTTAEALLASPWADAPDTAADWTRDGA